MFHLPRPEPPIKNNILIKNLINQLLFVRGKTISVVENLPVESLDQRVEGGRNSIGTILRHIAAMECHNKAITFRGRMLDEEERREWYGSLPGQLALGLIHGNSIEYYLQKLENERVTTLASLAAQDDDWLFEETLFKYDKFVNNYFCWFHYMEDEIAHVGQIKMLLSFIKG